MTTLDALLSDVQQAVQRHQPELIVTTADSLIVLEGLFVVSGPNGPFDSYRIQAALTAGFPAQEPVVFETGGRIPRIADRHVFPKDGNCCLGIWEEWLLTAPDHRFETFLTGPMHDYFVSQTYYEVNNIWPYGERSHGPRGVLESYSDILGIRPDPKIVTDYLHLLSRVEIKGHAVCPCGSGKRLRQCHSEDLWKLSAKIPFQMAKKMATKMSQILKPKA